MKVAKQFTVLAVLCLVMWGVGGFVPLRWIASAQDGGPEGLPSDGLGQAMETPLPNLDGLLEPAEALQPNSDGLIVTESLTEDLAAPNVQTDTGQWPQVQNDPQHTGYTPATMGTNHTVVWRRAFQPDKVHPQVQAIIYNRRVYVGTVSGKLYGLNSDNGNQDWVFASAGPILNSVAAGDNRVYFGSMDGAVYAVNSTTGAQIWKTQLSGRLGFSTAPVLSGGNVLIGGRNGVFYSLNPTSGAVNWSFKTGGPILMTAAANGNNVYFTSMDMRVYARSITTGVQLWTSQKIPGLAFKDYYPVVWGGYVYVRPWSKGLLGVEDSALTLNSSAQLAVLNAYLANPNKPISMYRLNESNGEFGSPVIHYSYQTMNGATAPFCVDRDGYLIMPSPVPGEPWRSGWGRVNPVTRTMVDVLSTSTGGIGSRDESMTATCSRNLIFTFHTQEQNAHYTGYFNMDNRTWTRVGLGKLNPDMFTNTQGGGANPVSIANNMYYHISVYELIARSSY